MVTEKYINIKTAKLLHEKGFDNSLCQKWYNTGKDDDPNYAAPVGFQGCLPACTIQMANEWLRENHNIMCVSIPYPNEDGISYAYKVYFLDKVNKGCFVKKQGAGFDEPAEALEDAINHCLNELI